MGTLLKRRDSGTDTPEGSPREDTGEDDHGQATERPREKPALPTRWPRTSSLQDGEDLRFCCLRLRDSVTAPAWPRRGSGVTAWPGREKNLSKEWEGQFLSPQTPARGHPRRVSTELPGTPPHPLFPMPQSDAQSAQPLLRPHGPTVLLLSSVHRHEVRLSL